MEMYVGERQDYYERLSQLLEDVNSERKRNARK